MAANRWAMLAVLFLARTSMALQFQSISPIAPLIIDDLAVNYAQIGLLIGLFMLPGIVISLPGAALGSRFGDRRMVLLGLAAMAAGGLIVGLGGSFELVLAGRVVSGMGAVVLNVLLSKMAADWFVGREISTAMAILIDSWPFGLALAMATLGEVGALVSWQAAIHCTTAAAVAGFVALALVYRDPPPPDEGKGGVEPGIRMPARNVVLSSLAGLVWMFFNVGLIVFLSFAPAYLVGTGMAIGEAGFLASLVMWVCMVLVPVGGHVTDRMGRPGAVIVGASLAAAAAMVAVPLLRADLILMIAIGAFIAIPAGAIVSLPVHFLPAAQRNMGFGIFYTWYYLGMAAFPPVAGYAGDLSANTAVPLYFAAGVTAMTAVALLALRRLER